MTLHVSWKGAQNAVGIFRVGLGFRFWLIVYSAGQKYPWPIFLVVPILFSALQLSTGSEACCGWYLNSEGDI